MQVTRRQFVRQSAAAAAGLAIVPAAAVRGSEANEKLRIGIIGCGARGPWIGRLFEERANAKVTAVHDYFKERVDRAGEQFEIPPEHRFIGLDGYLGLLDAPVDAVAIESPPYFHPEQTVAALAAGKHVFLAKPIAVDVPGCLDIVEAAKAAEGRLSTLVDFQTRNDEFFQGAAERVHAGMIGTPAYGQFHYHCPRLGIQAVPGTETARLRNWSFDIALSGDIIVEQNIHVLDVANWYLQGHPLRAQGTGGRKVRVDVGDCWDHFSVNYWYPNDVLGNFSSAQFTHGYDDLLVRIFGSEGTVEAHYGRDVTIRGRSDGWRGGNTGQIYQEGAANNVRDFCAGILAGEHVNNAEESAHSTMASILGRMAAYSGHMVTWEEMLAANERLDAELDLPEDGPFTTERPA